MNKHSLQRGVSLLEVLVFTALIGMIFVAILYATTAAIKRTVFNQNKILATHYAEEIVEWMRGEKETDWALFAVHSPGTYCMNATVSECDTGGTCWNTATACSETDYSLGDRFKRTTVLTNNGSLIDLTVTVEWIDGPNTYSVPISTTLSRWE